MQPCHWPGWDPRIRNLPSTTFCGERLSQRAIAEIQETEQFFSELSRIDLVRTVCVEMDWYTPGGPRLGFGQRVVGELPRRRLAAPAATAGASGPFRTRAAGDGDRAQGSGAVEPMGEELPSTGAPPADWRAPALLGAGRAGAACRPACCSTSRRGGQSCRDRFIGWEGQSSRERLHLMVWNPRYLPFGNIDA